VTLPKLKIKPYYDSGEDDILNEFYIPVLKESVEYRRLAGFFSSTSLAVAARGIRGLLENDGKMKLVAGAIFSKEDIEAIKEGIEKPEDVIKRVAIKDFDCIESELVRNHVRALGWMVANNRLEIRVAIVRDENGIPLDMQSILERGLFHQKVGILMDNKGYMISFSGSINETAKAWLENVEEIKVFRSWVESEYAYFKSDYEKFDRYWNGKTTRIEILEIPEAVKKRLIQMAPSNIEVLNLDWRHKNKKDKKIKLRDYQLQAIENWVNNNYSGFFEMATGTGKTYTAIGCLERLVKDRARLAVVITCPYGHLVEQWVSDLEDFNFDCIRAYGAYKKWIDNVVNAVFDYNNRYLDIVIIVTTHDTFCSTRFMDIIRLISDDVLLIADEVHGIGSQERRKGLLEKYKYRLALSATPNRWLDDEGTEILRQFFGKTVFEFPLKKAIESGYLTPYEYRPHFVSLTPDELEEYRGKTKKIAREYMRTKNKKERSKLLELLCIIRQKIVTNAVKKYQILENILDSEKDLSFCLIYCSPEQIDAVQEILNRRGIINHRFTARENISERKRIIKGFSEKAYNVLVAMNCLDEGVDVPPTRIAIILASSGNPRQYIQRRGRVLRKYPGKDKAIIHDFIVVPNVSKNTDPYLFELERKILRKELRRYEEFAKSSINYLDALNQIYPYMKIYDVYGGD